MCLPAHRAEANARAQTPLATVTNAVPRATRAVQRTQPRASDSRNCQGDIGATPPAKRPARIKTAPSRTQVTCGRAWHNCQCRCGAKRPLSSPIILCRVCLYSPWAQSPCPSLHRHQCVWRFLRADNAPWRSSLRAPAWLGRSVVPLPSQTWPCWQQMRGNSLAVSHGWRCARDGAACACGKQVATNVSVRPSLCAL